MASHLQLSLVFACMTTDELLKAEAAARRSLTDERPERYVLDDRAGTLAAILVELALREHAASEEIAPA